MRPLADTPEPRAISARDVLDFLWLRRAIILAVAAGVVGMSAFLTLYLISPSYEAAASIMIDASQVRPVVEASAPSDFEKVITFQTQIDIIRSAGIAGEVVDQLDLTHRRALSRVERLAADVRELRRQAGVALDIKSWQKPADPRAAAVEALLANLTVEAKPQSVVLKISYRAHDPEEAAATVNVLVERYTAFFNRQLRDRASGVVSYLDVQLRDVGTRLAASEQAMLAFKQNDRLAFGDPGDAAAGPPAAPRRGEAVLGLAAVTDSPKVEEELKLLVLTMDEELRKMQAQFSTSYPPALALKAKIARYVAALNELPQKEVEYRRLQRQLEFDQETYKYLRQNLERSRIVEVSNTTAIGLISVLERAVADDHEVAPKPRLIIPAGLVFGLLLGVAMAAVVNVLDHRVFSERDLAASLDLRVLGSLPRA